MRLSELMGIFGVIVLVLSVALPVGRTLSRDPALPGHVGERDPVEFDIVVRGYDPAYVDALVGLARAAARSNDPSLRADAAEELRLAAPAVRRRGFHRGQVEQFIADMQATLQEQRH